MPTKVHWKDRRLSTACGIKVRRIPGKEGWHTRYKKAGRILVSDRWDDITCDNCLRVRFLDEATAPFEEDLYA